MSMNSMHAQHLTLLVDRGFGFSLGMGGKKSDSGAWGAALLLSTGVTAAYIALYTGYDKKTKSLTPSNLVDFFLLRKGWNWTLVEANKALSLTGLTVMLSAFLPQAAHMRDELLTISMGSLWVHSAYSYYKFYGLDIRKVLSDKAMKQASLALGAAAQLSLVAGCFGQLSATVLAAATTVLGRWGEGGRGMTID
jgi:hypothetical protein